jgi:hypothetical protein
LAKDYLRLSARAFVASNRDGGNITANGMAGWRAKNRDKVREINRRYREKRKAALAA